MIGKAAAVAAVIAVAVVLTLVFWITPRYIIDAINGAQGTVVVDAASSSGNVLTGFRYRDLAVNLKNGGQVLSLADVELGVSAWRLFSGRAGGWIRSAEITGTLYAGLGGSIEGELRFERIPFDTEVCGLPAETVFTAIVSGRSRLTGNNVEIEAKIDEIAWRNLVVAGVSLPLDMFDRARGGAVIGRDRTIVRSLNFEGRRGNARLSGEIAGGAMKLDLELLPRNWDDPYLVPLSSYRTEPGVYRVPLRL